MNPIGSWNDSTKKSRVRLTERVNRLVYDVLLILIYLSLVSLISLILPGVFNAMTYPKERSIDQVIIVHEEELPIVPLKQRKPHPEESDEDDLPLLYRGLNPDKPRKLRSSYRLAEWIRPLEYDVTLRVGVRGHNGDENSTMKGFAKIKFKVEGDATNLLEIHAEFFKEFEFVSLAFDEPTSGSNNDINPMHQFYDEEKRTYSWLLESPLKDGFTYTLNLKWIGSIGYGTLGLYETWYFDGEGNRYSLTTQGQPMSTRKWMPCFDEPAMKAILNLQVVHPSSLTARSNGRILSSEIIQGGNLTKTVFAATPQISPYLYALSVSDYVDMKDTVEDIPISVVLPPTYKDHLNASLQLAKRSVEAFLSALNATRIFDKMDFVFVPDHGSAMENVGHISFGINHLDRYDTYAHEMMHNYFGNLITLKWWDEVWINEGLTTMYEIDAVHGIGTNASIIEYRKGRRQAMIETDSFRKTIPLKFDATTEVEARANFMKPYTKGAVVLLMIRNVVGEEKWKAGIELFLRKFAYQAVDGMDFLRTITDVAKESKDIGDNGQTPQLTMMMARSFFENVGISILKIQILFLRRGFPLVRITRKRRVIEFSQERFHLGFINGNEKENKERWAIPIHLSKFDGTPYKTFIMPDHSLSIEVDTDDDLILDPKKVVFYRAVYDKDTYRRIVKSPLSNATKDEIIDDLLHSAYSGYVQPDLAFSMFTLTSNEHLRYTVWNLHTKIALLYPDRLPSIFQSFTGNGNHSAFEKWSKKEFNVKKPEEYCNDINSELDLTTKYTTNRTYKYFLCPQTFDFMTREMFEKIIENGLDLSQPQSIHPIDFERIIHSINGKYPNIVSNIILKMASFVNDEFVLAKLISRARRALDARSTNIIRKIAEISPGAVKQNAAIITRIFNERHAIESEDRVLGKKLDKVFREAMAELRKQKKLIKYKTSNVNTIKIPEKPLRRFSFY